MEQLNGLEQLYRDTFPAAAKMLRAMGCDMETAKDLVQDAMVIYLEKRTLHIGVSPVAYIKGIARIRYLEYCRNSRQTISADMLPDDLAEIQEHEEPHSVMQYLIQAGQRCMQLLSGFYYEGKSMTELAKALGYRSPHSTSVQKYKCIEKIREMIKQQQHEEAA